ncbi:MAG: alpha/beta fold hydrolase [Leptospiraceae bacterium]|nr:alpha/beta fold hydrolase [Leptospiraceae bacterium]
MRIIRLKGFFCIFSLPIFLACTSSQNSFQGKIYHPKTKDGSRLSLEFFPSSRSFTRKNPVILCHGLAANRIYFKINGENSLVSILQDQGFDVYLLELRGRNLAGAPGLWFGKKLYDYNFDDYVKEDVDTAISEVLQLSKSDQVNWMGHSMGGMVAYARLGSYGEDRISNLVTLGSPFFFPEPNKTFQTWHNFSFLSYIIPVIPTENLASIRQRISLLKYTEAGLSKMIYYEPNIESDVLARLRFESVNNISPKEIRQFSDWVEDGRVASADKKIIYSYNLSKIQIPTLVVWGTRDNLSPSHVTRKAFHELSSKDKAIHIAGRSQGHSEDYGHTDLLIGRKAAEEVLKPAVAWLVARNKMMKVNQ